MGAGSGDFRSIRIRNRVKYTLWILRNYKHITDEARLEKAHKSDPQPDPEQLAGWSNQAVLPWLVDDSPQTEDRPRALGALAQ